MKLQDSEKGLAISNCSTSLDEAISIDDALEQVGSFGRYQITLFVHIIVIYCLGNFCLYPMGFYQLQPQYQCRSLDSNGLWSPWTDCSNQEACELKQNQLGQFQINNSSEKTLENWVQKFDMYCMPRKAFGLFGSMYFLGSMIGSFIIPRLSDIYGRKIFVVVSTVLHIIACVIILLNDNLILCYSMILVQGICKPGRTIMAFVWLTESVKKDQTTKWTSLLFTIDSFGIFFSSIYFRYISKDWRMFYGFPIVLMIGSTIALSFQDDPPKFYCGTGQFERARRCLTNIGRKNGKIREDSEFESRFVQEVVEKSEDIPSKKLSIRNFIRNRRYVCNSGIMIILFLACPFCYHMLNFYIKYIPGDIFINQIFNSVAEAIAQGPLIILCTHYFSIKSTIMISLCASILSYMLIMLFSLTQLLHLIPWAVLFTKGSISIGYLLTYVAVTHYFEPQYTGLVMAMTNILARFNTTATPLIAELSEPVPVIICIVYCIIALSSIHFLKVDDQNNKIRIDNGKKENMDLKSQEEKS